ncbi:SET and MYND domain-containing protein [Apiospora marii]|uniref:SET and MYND domain-containing protein n=1 Tax=Apiospora marii TaxID=335849 RepID=UPI003131BECF
MASYSVNDFVEVRVSSTSAKGAGLFAKRDLEAGHRVICEDPMLPSVSVSDSLSEEEKQQLARLPAGPGDVFIVDASQVPDPSVLFRGGDQLTSRVTYNEVKIATYPEGPMVGFHTAVASHSCMPNAYLCYNKATDSLDLHLVRDVKKDEEVTVSYFQDDYAFPKSVRAQKLQKWNYACPCSCCTTESTASDSRRDHIKQLFSDYDQLTAIRILSNLEIGLGGEDVPPEEDEYSWDLLDDLKQIVQLMKDEGLYGMAMTWVLVDLADRHDEVGDTQSQLAAMSEAVKIREMCLGVFHPDTRALAERNS